MKIAFYISSLGTSGGAERALVGLANKMAAANDVTLIVERGKREQSAYKICDKVAHVNLQDYFVKIPFRRIALLLTTRKIVKQINPDVVVSFLAMSNIRLLASGIYNNYPVVVCERNDPKSDPSSKKKRKIRDKLYKHASLIVVQTDEVKMYFQRLGYKNIDVIPNFVNTIPFAEVERTKTFMTAGRLTNQKNQKWLIDAFIKSQLNKRGYQLVIYGNGELKEELLTFIHENQAEHYVKLHPNVPNILEEMNKCYCFVLPSLYEGMPNALMEAMSMSLPCISTDCPCGGPRSLITNGVNGILVDLYDTEGLISAMQSIANNTELAKTLGQEAFKIRESNSIENITMLWEKSMQSVI